MEESVVANILGPILINRWFVKHKGLLLGLQMTVVGVFGAILQQVTANVITQNGWRYAYVSDRIGSLKTGYMLMSVGFASVVGLWFGNTGLQVFYIASFLLGLVSSGIMVLAPILTIAFYGNIHYEKMFAKVSMGVPIASVFLLLAYGYIYDFTQSYQMVLFSLSVLLIIASICISLG